MGQLWRIALGVGIGLAVTWLVLVVILVVRRPKGPVVKESLRLLPDTLRLLKRVAGDPSVPRGVKVRIALFFVYAAMPFDLIPDFIPVIGYADDLILAGLVIRSVVRRAGLPAVERHWPGSPDGLQAVLRFAGLPRLDNPASR